MNKTQHYQLNQWDPEDRILRVDFNADNAALDAALHAIGETAANGLAEESAARTAADSAIRTDFAAADAALQGAVNGEANTRAAQDAAIRGEFAAADAALQGSINNEANTRAGQDAAIRGEFAAADAAVAGQISMVKLYEAVTTYDVTQIDAYVGGLNLPGYSEIIIVPRIRMATSGASQIYVAANGNRSSIYYYGNQTNSNGLGSFQPYHRGSTQYSSGTRTKLCLDFSGEWVVGIQQSGSMSVGTVNSFSCGITTALPPSSITSLNFYAQNGNALLAGSKITIYGVR